MFHIDLLILLDSIMALALLLKMARSLTKRRKSDYSIDSIKFKRLF
ncbi:hypothetical protein [Helicobacter jaachi]|nr:hypothetical protein [Helicobacter jaachi]